ncbi:MAG: class I SAM-dependent methyltransferase [Clostridiaceae bacterium]|jgi:16S rRNA (guanine1207-N2)-methyltransferase|nr:methyltransferase [Bacillota bacterium]NLN52198.1 class I SAM-dependent methyltransferase [Clostridiaceae bacterium]
MAQSHYFKPSQDLEHQVRKIKYTIAQQDFEFYTDRGVFSRNKVDYGTDVMLKAVIKELKNYEGDVDNCLDLGCGYGVVSIVLNRLFPDQRWHAVDINPRAIELVKRNARKYKLNIMATEFDGVPDLGINYDLALLNPPIRTGKNVYYRMFREVADNLVERGVFYTVIQKKQGSASAFKYLQELFLNVSIIDKSGGYHTIRCSEKICS